MKRVKFEVSGHFLENAWRRHISDALCRVLSSFEVYSQLTKENDNPMEISWPYLLALAFPGECVNRLGSKVKSIPGSSDGWFEKSVVWHTAGNVWYKKILLTWSQAISEKYTIVMYPVGDPVGDPDSAILMDKHLHNLWMTVSYSGEEFSTDFVPFIHVFINYISCANYFALKYLSCTKCFLLPYFIDVLWTLSNVSIVELDDALPAESLALCVIPNP